MGSDHDLPGRATRFPRVGEIAGMDIVSGLSSKRVTRLKAAIRRWGAETTGSQMRTGSRAPGSAWRPCEKAVLLDVVGGEDRRVEASPRPRAISAPLRVATLGDALADDARCVRCSADPAGHAWTIPNVCQLSERGTVPSTWQTSVVFSPDADRWSSRSSTRSGPAGRAVLVVTLCSLGWVRRTTCARNEGG